MIPIKRALTREIIAVRRYITAATPIERNDQIGDDFQDAFFVGLQCDVAHGRRAG